MREPLFRLVLAKPDETILGFEWIEVLEVMPQNVSRARYEGDTEGEKAWRFQAQYLARTPHGITWFAGGDLEPEMDNGVYVEAGLVVWDADSKTLKSVESTCINGHAIQLNVETWGTEKAPRQAFPRKKKGTRKKG